jgi:glyoxylase I family protein
LFKRIDHVEIVASDLERSIEFYTGVFGFRVRTRVDVDAPPLRQVAYLELGDTLLELLAVSDPSPAGDDAYRLGYRMMALEVTDMAEAVAHLESRGLSPSWGPVELQGSSRAEVLDPDGFPIELRQWK